MTAHTPTPGGDAADFLAVYGGVLARGDDQTRDALTTAEGLLRSHDALVAALVSVRKRIRDVFVEDRVEDMIACRSCIDDIDAALKSARGES